MKTKKILIILFLILLSYFVYSEECGTVSDCDDDSYCTKDFCTSGNCSYTNVSGCIDANFKFLGDTFVIGEGACRDTYEYDAVYSNENRIELTKDLESIKLDYDNTTSDYYGHQISYVFNILNETVTFYLKYNETRNFLYLEDVNKSCPVSDLCSTSEDCDDNNTCTIDECDGTPLECVHHFIAYCKDEDGCCPSKCNATEDNDCVSDECGVDIDCDDNDPCTDDSCNGTPKVCLNIAETECVDEDDCCPSGCVYDEDKDCEKPIVCGDDFCEANETIDNCCIDCGCFVGYECVDNNCKKTKETIAKEVLEADDDFNKKKDKLIADGFDLKESLFSSTETGFDFSYVYEKGGKERIITGGIDEQNNISSIKVEGGISTFWYIIILVMVFLITIVGLSLYRNIKLKKQEKESYYSRLLQQRAQRQRPRRPFYRR